MTPKQHKRAGRRLPWTLLILAALIAAIVLGWLKCAGGWGIWGQGKGKGEGPGTGSDPRALATAVDAGTPRCKLRIDARGIVFEDRVIELAAATEACQPAKEADLTVTGDARYGLYEETKKALEAAGIRAYSEVTP